MDNLVLMKSLKEYIGTQDNIKLMKKRVEDHIDRVKYFYGLMIEEGLIPSEYQNKKEVENHDQDKFEEKNLRRQALRFEKNRNKEIDNEITEVVREHIKNNPHHFEHWGGEGCDQFSNNIDCSSMPMKYVYEMLADWASTAEEKGNTVTSFYEDHVGSKFNFSEEQDAVIRECAKFLDKHIDKSLKRTYSKVYVNPSKIQI